jgi:hypothetical protein
MERGGTQRVTTPSPPLMKLHFPTELYVRFTLATVLVARSPLALHRCRLGLRVFTRCGCRCCLKKAAATSSHGIALFYRVLPTPSGPSNTSSEDELSSGLLP